MSGAQPAEQGERERDRGRKGKKERGREKLNCQVSRIAN